MEKKLKMEGPILSFSSYKPKQGQEVALMELVKSQLLNFVN